MHGRQNVSAGGGSRGEGKHAGIVDMQPKRQRLAEQSVSILLDPAPAAGGERGDNRRCGGGDEVIQRAVVGGEGDGGDRGEREREVENALAVGGLKPQGDFAQVRVGGRRCLHGELVIRTALAAGERKAVWRAGGVVPHPAGEGDDDDSMHLAVNHRQRVGNATDECDRRRGAGICLLSADCEQLRCLPVGKLPDAGIPNIIRLGRRIDVGELASSRHGCAVVGICRAGNAGGVVYADKIAQAVARGRAARLSIADKQVTNGSGTPAVHHPRRVGLPQRPVALRAADQAADAGIIGTAQLVDPRRAIRRVDGRSV